METSLWRIVKSGAKLSSMTLEPLFQLWGLSNLALPTVWEQAREGECTGHERSPHQILHPLALGSWTFQTQALWGKGIFATQFVVSVIVALYWLQWASIDWTRKKHLEVLFILTIVQVTKGICLSALSEGTCKMCTLYTCKWYLHHNLRSSLRWQVWASNWIGICYVAWVWRLDEVYWVQVITGKCLSSDNSVSDIPCLDLRFPFTELNQYFPSVDILGMYAKGL